MLKFSDTELHTLSLALSVAADQYEKDAEVCREMGEHGERLAAQFDKQVREAHALQARIISEA